MKQYVIWKGIASVEIPDSFQVATIDEKRKIFGNYRKLPDFVLLDRQHGIRISCVDTDRIENLKKMDIEQTAQFMSHIYKRTVPGYRCHGIYKRADDDEVCAILYTHYILNDTLYTMSLIYKEQDTIHLLQCTCSNADTVEWHPVFKNIVESICFNKKEKRHDKGTM